VEETAVLESSGELNGFSLLVHVPLTPLKGFGFHRADKTLKELA